MGLRTSDTGLGGGRGVPPSRIVTEKARIDGRGPAESRALSAEIDLILPGPRPALFERGETQILGATRRRELSGRRLRAR